MKKPEAYLPAIRGDAWDPFVKQLGALISEGVRDQSRAVSLPITYSSGDPEPLGTVLVIWTNDHWTICFELLKAKYEELRNPRVDNLSSEGWMTSYPSDGHVWLWLSKPLTFSPEASARYLVELLNDLGFEARGNWHPELAKFSGESLGS
jgi:hypothetical protein